MRKIIIAAVALALCLAASAIAERSELLLYTVYEQVGWGDTVQVGCVDEDGGLWTLEGSAAELGWPYKLEEQLDYLASSSRLQKVGELDHEDVFAIESLIYEVEDRYEGATGVACDAGVQISYAMQYDRDGACTPVRLGMSGDDMYENTDPNAQALYARLKALFPNVTCFGDNMGPAGFQPVPVAEFCHIDTAALEGTKIVGWYDDCEEGPIPMGDDADVEAARDIVLHGVVTGKANAIETSGDIDVYVFYDKDDNYVASIDLYHGLLVWYDGMYELG